MLGFFLVLAAISFLGMSLIIFRHLAEARRLSPEELAEAVRTGRSIHGELFNDIFVPACERAQEKIKSRMYSDSEKFVRRSRILTLKLENKLQRLTDHLRGKRTLGGNGNGNGNGKNAEYWTEVAAHKEADGK